MDGDFSIIITTSASALKILSPAQTQSQKENSIWTTMINIEMSIIKVACLFGNEKAGVCAFLPQGQLLPLVMSDMMERLTK